MQAAVRILLCLALLLGVARAHAQQEFASESKTWKFTAPDGWNMIGSEAVRAQTAKLREQYPNSPTKYLIGFTRGAMNTMAYPRVLITTANVDMSGLTLEDLDAGLSDGAPTSDLDEARKLFMIDAGLNRPATLDPSRMRAFTSVEKNNDKGEPVNIRIYAYLGKNQIVRFECADLVSSGSRAEASFDEFVNTFSFSPEAKLVPASSSAGGPFEGYSDEPYKSQSRSSSSSSGGWRYRRFGFGGLGLLGAIIAAGIIKLIFRD
ncbi:MAG TPA: hypothetical protein VD997_06335 [Phycisphaerales bacterium]|nr:hypothetical protein [Phycisphaerales bacterium]